MLPLKSISKAMITDNIAKSMAYNSTSAPIKDNSEGNSQEYVEESKSNPSLKTPPSLKEQYIFIKELGHGAQAKIYLALRLSDQQSVVIKQLNIGSVKTWKEYDLFQREAKVLESIHISGVAQFYDAIDCLEDDPPCSYIVQEYIEGASLGQMLKAGHRFKVDEVYDILIQLLKILMKLHGMTPPVIHRDIKPSNIMISPLKSGYKVTLIDFGAVANPQVQSGGSTVAGTFGYMPPEQLMGHPEPASDIYALAAVAVELFTGKSPANLPQKDFRLIFEPEMEQMPPALINTLRKMLEPKVENRFVDVPELTKIFAQFKEQNYAFKWNENKDVNRDRDFNAKIEAIESIGDDGNIDIWQALPDTTPRDVPKSLMSYYVVAFQIAENNQGIRKNGSELKAEWIKWMIIIMLSVVFTPFLLISIPYLIFQIAKKNQLANEVPEMDNRTVKCTRRTENLFGLLQNGRKTIATITSIEYMPLADNKIVSKKGLKICGVPCFKIQYKFNPPDDAREEDLVHEYISHVDPDGHFKVGDPIPILYQIDKNFFGENVISMPFPFPLKDSNLDEIIYESSPNNIVVNQNSKLLEDRYEYQEHVKPILKSINNKDRNKLLKDLKEHAWLIGFEDDQRCLNLLLSLGEQLLESDDVEIHEALGYALAKGMYYRDEVTRRTIGSFFVKELLNHNHLSEGLLCGLLNCENCNYPQDLADKLIQLYKTPSTENDIKKLLEEKMRMPLRYMPNYMSDQTLESLIPAMFNNWKFHLHELKDQNAFFEALNCFFSSPHPSSVYCEVFKKAYDCVGFWNKLPKACNDAFKIGYLAMDDVHRREITSFRGDISDKLTFLNKKS